LASGRAVENGTFYYPQISLWRQLDKDRVDSNAYNRYQHLNFTGGLVDGENGYRIESPREDWVQVVIDLEKFDFRNTGAIYLAAPQIHERLLRNNSSLAFISSSYGGWVWFQISDRYPKHRFETEAAR
jgi:hypothetical protein